MAALIELRRAEPDDLDFILACRNDPDSIRWSRSGRALERQELAERLAHPECRSWIAELERAPVGYVYWSPVEWETREVALALAPAWRGHKLSVPILRAMLHEANTEHIPIIRALIHPDNLRSLRTFARAGFRSTGHTIDGFSVWIA